MFYGRRPNYSPTPPLYPLTHQLTLQIYNYSKFKPIISQTTVTVLFLTSSLWAVSDCPPQSVCCWAPWWLSPGPSLARLFSSLFPSAASVVFVSPSAVAQGPYTPPHPGNDGGSQTRPWFLVPRHQNCSERQNRNRGVTADTVCGHDDVLIYFVLNWNYCVRKRVFLQRIGINNAATVPLLPLTLCTSLSLPLCTHLPRAWFFK